MKVAAKKCMENCVICQRNKSLTLVSAGLLLPLEIHEAIWTHLSMDFKKVFLDQMVLTLDWWWSIV